MLLFLVETVFNQFKIKTKSLFIFLAQKKHNNLKAANDKIINIKNSLLMFIQK